LIMIIQTMYERTLAVVDEARATWIRNLILGAAATAPKNPARYIKAVLDKEPNPRARFLPPADVPPESSSCGRCGPNHRLEDPETGKDAGPCPDCHPSNARAS
jgi:hypothetical protein